MYNIFLFLGILLISVAAIDFDSPSEVFAIIGTNETLVCQANEPVVWWSKDGTNITKTDIRFERNTTENEPFESENELKPAGKRTYSHTLMLVNVTKEHNGTYLCHFPETEKDKNVSMQISFSVISVQLPRIIPPVNEEIKIKEKESQSVDLVCVISALPTALFNGSVKWEKETIDRLENKDSSDASEINAVISNRTKISSNDTHITISVRIDKASKKHNGTYICSVSQPLALDKSFEKIEKRISILIQSAPIAMISFVKAIGKNRIFLNWTVTDDGNSPIQMFLPQFKMEFDTTFHYTPNKVGANQTSMVIEKLIPDTKYQFKISAKNEIGSGPVTDWNMLVKTLTEDPVFTPIIEVKGNSHSTITIGWQPPSQELLDYIHYYEVIVFQADNKTIEEAIHPQNSRNLPYMVMNLKTATEYFFKVRACSEYNKECGNWSETVNGTTMDGQSSAPLDVKIICMHHNVSRRNIVSVEWSAPSNPNGIIMSYQVLLDGTAHFKSETGNFVNQTWGPKAKNVDRTHETKAIYDNVPANTNFTVNIAAITRSKKPGEKASALCTMPPTIPDAVPKAHFGKQHTEDYNWIFKLSLPRVSERNGKVCCYRIYMIRLGKDLNEKQPEDMDVMTYEDAHNATNLHGGAYLANIIPSANYQADIPLGSGQHYKVAKNLFNEKCRGCLSNIIRRKAHVISETEDEEEDKEEEEGIEKAEEVTEETKAEIEIKTRRRRRRHGHSEQSEPQQLNILDSLSLNHAVERSPDSIDIFDGPLDISSNYSGFVEVIVENNDFNDDKTLSVFGDFFPPLSPKPPTIDDKSDDQMLMAITYLLAGLIILVISLFFLLCLLHRYQKKHIIQGNEIVSLTDSLRLLCHGGRANHHQHRSLNTVSKPPDLPPILRENLPQAYVDRHKDSDYGFQHEFELLPDRFTDRTSRSGDMKENVYKNRYPDIKCYDQTRVKLSTLNGLVGSDYINANFVIGYKERKKFICAQGPMDSTVNDFWRMIWEQHLEIIIMLTNLEEYNKTKCAKYWPERVSDSVQFGEMTVTFESEQRFSDYLIRNIKLIKRNLNSDAENATDEPARNITQYHYLVWKDFQAPEHPYGILKFIKTINADYSVQRGPLLIHCSAGVGRTGTLVALDSLKQQLNEENQVAIFNTICDMRHQRNYLVQSLKQYIFLYRALLDVAQFDDTELRYKGLAASVEALKQRTSDSKEQSKLEIQYAKLKSLQDDIRKTCSVGGGDENLAKNRHEDVIPFDRNRVILTPIPGRDHSTYINASFIEGYDNQESFIIAQDPLESTIGDFWRMISEQSIPTIVMMSEIGDVNNNKCPRYWADDEIQYDHILVKYIQSESCPYYTKREFSVTNCKINDTINVTHFQYNGWPTVDGEGPEVTRGILEIVHQSQTHHQSKIDEDSTPRPMLVHCCKGTDRSSIFVSMCVLVQQLRLEKRVDIRVTTQKLRTQRAGMIDSVNSYEFLHRALVDFANLHKSSFENSPC
ncbi:CLUMA_CG011889, isoform A [Clunio marinus]|uniref:protein-tyrosine-phosphatase n=1 Tax=Clunio marinus TaxID=568069 RepID=A0A1J1IFK4_9DIPT|nr:CLUMA_CG011889, isoform A [Clunio marinus]